MLPLACELYCIIYITWVLYFASYKKIAMSIEHATALQANNTRVV